MAEYKTPVTGHAFRYAAIIAGLSFLLLLVKFLFDMLENNWLDYISIVVFLVGFYLVGHKFRQDKLDGYISYGKSFRVIFKAGLFFGLIMMFANGLLFAFLSEDTIQELIRIDLHNFVEKRPSATQQEVDFQRTILEFSYTWWGQGISNFLGGIFGGLFLGLIYSLIIQKDSPNASPFK